MLYIQILQAGKALLEMTELTRIALEVSRATSEFLPFDGRTDAFLLTLHLSICVKRCDTARCAIVTMGSLAQKYGISI